MQYGWERLESRGDEVVRNKVENVIPKYRHLRENLAFSGYRCWEDAVEGRNAVGGYDEEAVAKIENLAAFSTAKFFYAGKITFKKGPKNRWLNGG